MTIDTPRFTNDDEAREFIRSESPIPPQPEPPVPPKLSEDDLALTSDEDKRSAEVPEPNDPPGIDPGSCDTN